MIRRAEKWMKAHEGDQKVDELLYRLKKAILEEDDPQAEELGDQLQYYTGA